MSDYEHSSVTYTSVPSPVEDYSDIRSPEVNGPLSPDYVPGPEEPKQEPLSPDYVPGPKDPEQAPLSPDYVPGPEEPEQAPPLPVYLLYVPELVYPEYMPPEDDVFPAEEQPLPVAATPTADSPGYISESDLKEDLEEDDKEDPEEDPSDYLSDSTVVALPAIDHVPSEEIPESCLTLRKRLRFASPTPSPEVEESSAADAARHDEHAVARDDPYSLVREELYGFFDRVDVSPRRPMSKELDYGITDTWDELVGANEEIAPTTLQGVNQRVTNLSTIVEHETTIMYEREARMAREAWGLSMDASDNAHSDVMSLHTTLVAQHALILDLQVADHKRQGVIKELLAADHKRQKMAPKRTTRSTPVITTPTPETTTLVTNAQLQAMINQGVTAALVARDANRNGDDSHTSGMGRPVQVARECTYLDFLKCQPLNFKGTEGVVGLSQWFEKMESVYSISNCTLACQVKFSMCTLQGNALTLWNSHVKGTDVVAYSQRFQELALMCDRMFPEEIDKVEKYVDGLPDTIHGSAERQADNKRKSNDTTRNNLQQLNKRQNTERAYATGNGKRKEYTGTLPLCNKCKFHHNGQCTIKNQGHYKSNCPKLKNQDHGNQAGGTGAHVMVHALEGGETNQDLNDVEDDINA
nr:hypothetical protein [Tanacetum cinerariifolium]